MNWPLDRRDRGFSLLEVILALGVFLVAGVGLMTALNQIAIASTESVDELRITARLRTLLTEVSRTPAIEPSDWTTEPDANGVAFHLSVEPAEYSSAQGEVLGDLFRIRIEAFRRKAGGGREVIEFAETLRYGGRDSSNQ